MSVEGGSSAGAVGVGAAVSMGPSISRIGSGIEGGFAARGGIAALEVTAPLGKVELGRFSLDREGPVAPEALNTMDIVAKPMSSVIQQAAVPSGTRQAGEVAAKAWEAPQLNATEAIADAQTIISQAQKPLTKEEVFADSVNSLWIPDPFGVAQGEQVRDDNKIESMVIPHVEPGVLLVQAPAPDYQLTSLTKPQTESRVYHQGAPAVSPQPLLQEQEVEEEVLGKVTKDEAGMVEEEEIEKTRRKYVVDERALSQVVVEFKAAVRKARELAGKLGIKITGKLISKFLPGQHPGNESEAVKGKGPDGSIPAREQSVEELGELSLDTQTEDKVVKVAYEKPPIKIRSEGEPVSDVDVARVFKPYVVKPAVAAYAIVTKRIEKKVPVVPAGQVAQTQTETRVETSLEDYPDLAEIFKH